MLFQNKNCFEFEKEKEFEHALRFKFISNKQKLMVIRVILNKKLQFSICLVGYSSHS